MAVDPEPGLVVVRRRNLKGPNSGQEVVGLRFDGAEWVTSLDDTEVARHAALDELGRGSVLACRRYDSFETNDVQWLTGRLEIDSTFDDFDCRPVRVKVNGEQVELDPSDFFDQPKHLIRVEHDGFRQEAWMMDRWVFEVTDLDDRDLWGRRSFKFTGDDRSARAAAFAYLRLHAGWPKGRTSEVVIDSEWISPEDAAAVLDLMNVSDQADPRTIVLNGSVLSTNRADYLGEAAAAAGIDLSVLESWSFDSSLEDLADDRLDAIELYWKWRSEGPGAVPALVDFASWRIERIEQERVTRSTGSRELERELLAAEQEEFEARVRGKYPEPYCELRLFGDQDETWLVRELAEGWVVVDPQGEESSPFPTFCEAVVSGAPPMVQEGRPLLVESRRISRWDLTDALRSEPVRFGFDLEAAKLADTEFRVLPDLEAWLVEVGETSGSGAPVGNVEASHVVIDGEPCIALWPDEDGTGSVALLPWSEEEPVGCEWGQTLYEVLEGGLELREEEVRCGPRAVIRRTGYPDTGNGERFADTLQFEWVPDNHDSSPAAVAATLSDRFVPVLAIVALDPNAGVFEELRGMFSGLPECDWVSVAEQDQVVDALRSNPRFAAVADAVEHPSTALGARYAALSSAVAAGEADLAALQHLAREIYAGGTA